MRSRRREEGGEEERRAFTSEFSCASSSSPLRSFASSLPFFAATARRLGATQTLRRAKMTTRASPLSPSPVYAHSDSSSSSSFPLRCVASPRVGTASARSSSSPFSSAAPVSPPSGASPLSPLGATARETAVSDGGPGAAVGGHTAGAEGDGGNARGTARMQSAREAFALESAPPAEASRGGLSVESHGDAGGGATRLGWPASAGGRRRGSRSFALFLILLLSIVLFVSFVITPFSSFLIDLSFPQHGTLSASSPSAFPDSSLFASAPAPGSSGVVAASDAEKGATANPSSPPLDVQGVSSASQPPRPPKTPSQLRLEAARAQGYSAAAAFPDDLAVEGSDGARGASQAARTSLSNTLFSRFAPLALFSSLSGSRSPPANSPGQKPHEATPPSGAATPPEGPSPPTAVGGDGPSGTDGGGAAGDGGSLPLFTSYRPVGWGAEGDGGGVADPQTSSPAAASSAPDAPVAPTATNASGGPAEGAAVPSTPATAGGGAFPASGAHPLGPLLPSGGTADGWRGELAEFADYNGDSHVDMIFISRAAPGLERQQSLPPTGSTGPVSPLAATPIQPTSTPRSQTFASVYVWAPAAGAFRFLVKTEIPDSAEALVALDWNGDGRADLLAVCVAGPHAVAEARREAAGLLRRLEAEEEGATHTARRSALPLEEAEGRPEGAADEGAQAEGLRKETGPGAADRKRQVEGAAREVESEVAGKHFYLVAYVQRADGRLERVWDSISGVDALLARLEKQRALRRSRVERAQRAVARRRQREARTGLGKKTVQRDALEGTTALRAQDAGAFAKERQEKEAEQAAERGGEEDANAHGESAPRRRRLADGGAPEDSEGGVVKEASGEEKAALAAAATPQPGSNQQDQAGHAASVFGTAFSAWASPLRRFTNRSLTFAGSAPVASAAQSPSSPSPSSLPFSSPAASTSGRRAAVATPCSRGGRAKQTVESLAADFTASVGSANDAEGDGDQEARDREAPAAPEQEDGISVQGVRVWARFPESRGAPRECDATRKHLEALAALPLLRYSSIHPLVADVTVDGRPDLVAQAPLFAAPSSSPPSFSDQVRRFVWVASPSATPVADRNRGGLAGAFRRLAGDAAPASQHAETALGSVDARGDAEDERRWRALRAEPTAPADGREAETAATARGEEGQGQRSAGTADAAAEEEAAARQRVEEEAFQPVLWRDLEMWVANAAEEEDKQRLGRIVSPHSSAVVDLDGDCRPDLVFQVELPASASSPPSPSSRFLEIWLSRFNPSDGRARFSLGSEGAFLPLPATAGQVAFADFNADGTLDLVMPTCLTAEACNGCCVDADRIVFAPNKQPGLCPSLWSFSDQSRGPCKAADNLCGTSEFFSLPPMNETSNQFTVSAIDADPRVHFYGDSDHPATLRVGDWNGDGFPDLAFIAVRNGGYRTARLYHNVPAENDPALRTFELAHDFSPQEGGDGTALLFDQMSFFDLFEDGSLDVFCMGQTQPPVFSPSPFSNSRAFLRSADSDARFLKVTTLSAADAVHSASLGDGELLNLIHQNEGKGEKGAATLLQLLRDDVPPYGVASHGPAFKLTVTDLNGLKTPRTATQLSQSAHSPLQLPYVFFGLGRTNNYIEEFYVGMPLYAQIYYNMWISLIPNSQVVVSPSPLYCPQAWQLDLSVNPSKHFFYILVTTVICLIVVAIIIFILDRREKAEDSELHRGFRSHFIIN
ncbi:FG-GAP repeat-containing protein [Besnoitia besnoiti]|uniref:FG-GAP repeat-containing protein n=1 Tax=Besnoitia besnoiti TaxID=94643 RepID=A0A2A9M152_BESBE|nr:FG-GAP repeat-containing protein [Besnoitia besnoiti]PFH32278.1 FG-GAP repeat-containing protein [Besnoitia besnoiti]